jgi:hypothetical protein
MQRLILFLGGTQNKEKMMVSDHLDVMDVPVYPTISINDEIPASIKPVRYETYRRRRFRGGEIVGEVECFGLEILDDDEVLDLLLQNRQN